MNNKIIIAAIAAVSALFICSSCQKQELIEPNKESNAEVRIFTASIEQGPTKTTVTNDHKLFWADGDQIVINGKVYNAKPQKDSTRAEFSPVDGQAEPVDGEYHAFSPASLYKDGCFEIPATQKYSASVLNTPMCAVSKTQQLLFRNVCGVLCFSLRGEYKVKSITLTANENICGKIEMTDEVNFIFTGEGKTVTIDCGDGVQLSPDEVTNFYMYMPPQTYTSGMKIEVTTAEGKVYWKNTIVVPQKLVRNSMNSFNWRIAFPEYVTIGDLKWTKQNLAVSASGGKSWKGNNASAVKLPGTDKDAIVGDYFQWAAYAGYCGKGSDNDNGLLVYTAFNNTKCVGDAGSNGFTFKEGKTFANQHAPYYDRPNNYKKYTDKEHATLDRTGAHSGHNDDVANIVYGGNWRIPTKDEIDAMRAITYWEYDETDYGYYVYTPVSGDEGGSDGYKATGGSISGTYDKSAALLFFPLSGSGYQDKLLIQGGINYDGNYWSSSFDYSQSHSAFAYSQPMRNKYVSPMAGDLRYSGCPVRAVCSVSDKE